MSNSVIIRRSLKEFEQFCNEVNNSTYINLNESKKVQDARKNLVLSSYNEFVKKYFPLYADSDCAYFHIEAANAILADPNIFAAIEWPREHAKTVHMCLILPMWLFIHGQLDGMILMSRNEDMAVNALSDIQAHFQYNQLFIHDWGIQFSYGDWSAADFTTKGGIRFLGLGRGQAPQGARKGQRRPNLGVCSDLDDYKIVENEKLVDKVVNVILGALLNALALKGSRLIVENNRIHPRGILAKIVGDVTPQTPKREGIWHSKVFATESRKGVKAYISEGGQPAWKERYTNDVLERRFKKLGPTITSAEFYHEHNIEGKIFKNSMMHWRPSLPLGQYNIIIGYFDPSFENNPTSDFKAVRVWAGYTTPTGLWEKHCLKSFVRKTEVVKAYEFMSAYEDRLPLGVGVLWYVEKQFFNRPIKDALFNHNQKRRKEGKKELVVSVDTRVKEGKYVRMVKMEPAYTDGEVFFDLSEIYNPDMIEGNNQLKGIEPGYSGADDSPDADEGAWYYVDQHKTGRAFKPIIGARNKASGINQPTIGRHKNRKGW